MEAQKAIEAALAQLGETADDVAERLRRFGHVGKRCVGDRCPVYRYLDVRGARAFRGLTMIVEMDAVFVKRGNRWLGNAAVPPPVQKFIERFDTGAYPELEERDECELGRLKKGRVAESGDVVLCRYMVTLTVPARHGEKAEETALACVDAIDLGRRIASAVGYEIGTRPALRGVAVQVEG